MPNKLEHESSIIKKGFSPRKKNVDNNNKNGDKSTMMNLKERDVKQSILVFTFLSTFLVGAVISIIFLIHHFFYTQDLLSDRVTGTANIWAETISVSEVEAALENREEQALEDMVQHLQILNKRFSEYMGSFLLKPELDNNQLAYVIAAPDEYDEFDMFSHSDFVFAKTSADAIRETIQSRETTTTSLYQAKGSHWITAFAPIQNEQGELIAILAVDINAEMLISYVMTTLFFLICLLTLASVLLFILFRKGMNRFLTPIQQIIRGIKEVSTGNFQVRLAKSENKEIMDLSLHFNEMCEKLEILFEKVHDTSQNLGSTEKSNQKISGFEEAIGEMERIIEQTKLQKELQQAEKMNAIGQLAASVAHEIRNPMTVVKGFLQIFQSNQRLSASEQSYIKLMIEELNRAEMIINDYLSLAKPELEKIEMVDLDVEINKVMDIIQSYAMMSKNVELSVHTPISLQAKVNKNEFKQLLINILKNGIEAMKDQGGTLSVSLTIKQNRAVISISDTGIGMTEEELANIGTVFNSLKEKGTGIGLVVCYQIVERMKGKMVIDSIKGQGTTFYIEIPLVIPSA